MQQSRRSTPYPSTWEIPLAAATAVTLALVVAAHTGRTVANGVTGHGWAWTPRERAVHRPARHPGGRRPRRAATRAGRFRRGPPHGGRRRRGPHRPGHRAGRAGWAAGVGPRADARHGHPRPGRGPARSRPAPPGRAGRPPRPAPHPQVPRCDGWNRARWGGGSGSPTNRAAAQLWVPWDRTAGVIGPQGSGKTLDLLIPALLAAPGAALVTLTKADDLLLSIGHRSTGGPPLRRAGPVRARPGTARAGLGPGRRVRGPHGRREARQGVHRRHHLRRRCARPG